MKRFGWILLVIVAMGCDDKADPGGSSGDGVDGGVTYAEHIKPILDTHCTGCHSSTKTGGARNGAPVGVDFDTYDNAVDSASEANSTIQSGVMPPSGSLSAEQKALFQQWIDEGLEP